MWSILLREKVFVCAGKHIFEVDNGAPAQTMEPLRIEELPGRSVGFGRIKGDAPFVSNRIGDLRRKLGNGDVAAHTNVEDRWQAFVAVRCQQGAKLFLRQRHYVYTRGRHVVRVHELATRCSASPDRHRRSASDLCFVKPTNEGRDYVTVRRMIVVAPTVKVRGHHSKKLRAVLAVVAASHLRRAG